MSPHTAYPFALYDTCILPWGYVVFGGYGNVELVLEAPVEDSGFLLSGNF
jgi:hypothetical protein